MRYKIDDDDPQKNGDSKKITNLLLSLKNVEDLEEDMQEMVAANAAYLSQSLQRGTDRAVEDAKKNGEEIDQIAAVLAPFVMELAYLKINLAAVSNGLQELMKNGKSD